MNKITFLIVFMFVSMFNMATNYYVSSISPNRSNTNQGTSPDLPWANMSKVNGYTFAPGDTVRFYGTITDQYMTDPGIGTQSAPIVFMGTGPVNGRAMIKGISLSNTQHVEFLNFECSTADIIQIRTVNTSKNPVKFLKFENLYLHGGVQGIAITIPTATDITFENTIIDQMDEDGILLSDPAGDRFSYIGGSITNTGKVNPGWHVHGCYASGGTGHLFDGVVFRNNAGGCAVSIRRGGITIRNCQFYDLAYTDYINNCNEDEASGINHYTGSRSKNQYYMIYRNLFVGGEAMYQSDKLYNGADLGVDDPGNVWAVFNNTFVNSGINFSGSNTTNYARFYDIYMRNNVFVNSKIKVGFANAGKIHELSNNGWWNSQYNGSTSFPGAGNLTTNPLLDVQYNVTSEDYKDMGVAAIAPENTVKGMQAVIMINEANNPWYYFGTNPDIGMNEYGGSVTPNIIPVALIDEITPNPVYYGSVVSLKGTGLDADGSISAWEWSSDISGIISNSEDVDFSEFCAGTHVLSFRVKDNFGAWSLPVKGTLVVNSNPSSLVADWKFNENEGTIVADSSPYQNTASLANGATWVTGKNGNGLNFNNSYVDIPGSSSLNGLSKSITLSAWVKASSNTEKSMIIERWLYGTGINQRSFCLYLGTSGAVSFGISKDGSSAGAKWLTTSETVPWNTWTYITATFDGTTMKIYLNGVLSTSIATGFSTFFVPTENIHIGNWQTTATSWEAPFKGVIDEVKIYNEALSLAEINNLYNNIPLAVDVVTDVEETKCYPNPFTSNLNIDYNTSESGKVSIEIYNLNGQLIQKVVDDEHHGAGKYSTQFNAENMANGLYLCKVVINGRVQMYKILKK
ncbi:MAG: T9SS type A sorting domain-containing protein [Paludibacter sp.]|nr:T9SS type A sorting domain-containing protein [Paludibacter sp.]